MTRIASLVWLSALGVAVSARAGNPPKTRHCQTYRVGTNRALPMKEPIFSFSFVTIAKGDRWLAYANERGKGMLTDLQTGESRDVGSVSPGCFSSDGRSFVYQPDPRTIVIRDLKTGNEIRRTADAPIRGARFTANGKALLLRDQRGSFILQDPRTGRESTIDANSIATIMDRNARLAILTDPKEGYRLSDLETGTTRALKGLPPKFIPYRIYASPDGRFAAIANGNDRALLLDLQTGKRIDLPPEFDAKPVFSPDGKMVAYVHAKRLYRHSLPPGGPPTVTEIDARVDEIAFSRDGRAIEYPPGGRLLLHGRTDSGPVTEAWPSAAEHHDLLLEASSGTAVRRDRSGGLRVANRDYVCAEPIAVTDRCAECATTGKSETTTSADPFDSVRKPMERLLCDGPWTKDAAKSWDAWTGSPKPGPLSLERARKFLIRFQKPGGFAPKTHLPVLLGILRSPLPRTDAALVRGALQNVLLASNDLYADLMEEFPELKKIPPTAGADPCRTPTEEKEIDAAALRHYRDLLSRAPPEGASMAHWGELRPLVGSLARFTPAQKAEFREAVAQSLADAASNERWRNVFASKLYKFAYEGTAPLFGEKSKPLSDITLVRDPTATPDRMRILPVILGVSPIGGRPETETEFGFSARMLEAIPIPREAAPGKYVARKVFLWEHAGEKFVADVDVVAGRVNSRVLTTAKGPDYRSMWKDGSLNGVVVSGSNLRSVGVVHHYLSYYQKQGFRFGPNEAVPDLLAFLREQVATGIADYLIKEAHSDGDERNLFRIDTRAVVRRGTRRLPDGKQETVALVFPAADGGKGRLISNQEFGEWIRARAAAKRGQLLYLNGSCSSIDKATNEVGAANSPLLLDIPAVNLSITFSDRPHSALRAFVDAFRREEDFAGIRAAVARTPGYFPNRTDHYVFPDERIYQEKVLNASSLPLDLRIAVKRNGEPYHFDEN